MLIFIPTNAETSAPHESHTEVTLESIWWVKVHLKGAVSNDRPVLVITTRVPAIVDRRRCQPKADLDCLGNS